MCCLFSNVHAHPPVPNCNHFTTCFRHNVTIDRRSSFSLSSSSSCFRSLAPPWFSTLTSFLIYGVSAGVVTKAVCETKRDSRRLTLPFTAWRGMTSLICKNYDAAFYSTCTYLYNTVCSTVTICSEYRTGTVVYRALSASSYSYCICTTASPVYTVQY